MNKKKIVKIVSSIVIIIIIVLGLSVYSSCVVNAPDGMSTPDEVSIITETSVVPTTFIEVITEPPTELETEIIIENNKMEEIESAEKNEVEEEVSEVEINESINYAEYTPQDLEFQGILYWGDWKWTWYSENVLPGGELDIPGRYTENSTGFVCDENGYICLASDSLDKGTVVDTPFGRQGKVYDCGCAADVLDVYVGW